MSATDNRYLHLVRHDCPLTPGTHVVVYCRDSGGEEQDRSVSQQVETAREYCQHHNLVLEKIYIDEARLSSNTEKRDALQEMLFDLRRRFKTIHDRKKRNRRTEENPFGVVFWKSNRLGRDSIEATNIKTDLRLRGITLIDLMTSANTGNAAVDALIEAFQQWKDEQDLEEISQNAKRGLAQLVGTRDTDPEFRKYNPDWESTGAYLGIRPGGVPTGFKGERIQIGVYERKKGRTSGEPRIVQRLVPDPETWDRCYLAWQMRHEGAGYAEIHKATRLFKNANGYDTFFSNLIYTGDIIYGGKLYENFVPALIPREWFEAEQKRQAENAKKHNGKQMDSNLEPRRRGAGYLLSGLVFLWTYRR
ncbi:recombinase family protein [bacterium]|nr:recombinase family protein [bacterium]